MKFISTNILLELRYLIFELFRNKESKNFQRFKLPLLRSGVALLIALAVLFLRGSF